MAFPAVGKSISCAARDREGFRLTLSPRLAALVAALPLAPGLRVLEIGAGPGAAARAVAGRIAPGCLVAIDRSDRAVALARTACAAEIAAGLLEVRCHAAARCATIVVLPAPPFCCAKVMTCPIPRPLPEVVRAQYMAFNCR